MIGVPVNTIMKGVPKESHGFQAVAAKPNLCLNIASEPELKKEKPFGKKSRDSRTATRGNRSGAPAVLDLSTLLGHDSYPDACRICIRRRVLHHSIHELPFTVQNPARQMLKCWHRGQLNTQACHCAKADISRDLLAECVHNK